MAKSFCGSWVSLRLIFPVFGNTWGREAGKRVVKRNCFITFLLALPYQVIGHAPCQVLVVEG